MAPKLPADELVAARERTLGAGAFQYPSDTVVPTPLDRTDPTRWNDATFDVTAAAAGVRCPEQANRLATLRVKFVAAGGNSGPVLVQRGLGIGGSVAPAFDSAAFSVPAGQHFWADGPVEQWWVKTADADDVLHVTGKRT